MNPLPDYTISEHRGYFYIRFASKPGTWLRNRMRAAGMYYVRNENVWIADDRFDTNTIIRIIGMNGNSTPTEVQS